MASLCCRATMRGERLDDRVDDRTVGVRTGGSVPADRHVDHARVARLDVVVAEAEPVHDAGPEVLHHHIGARHELGDQAAPLVGGRVDADPPLPPVVVQQQRAEAPARERAQPEDVAQPRRLDLHDVGALLRQHHRGQRPRRQLAQIDDPHPLQRLAHRLPPSAAEFDHVAYHRGLSRRRAGDSGEGCLQGVDVGDRPRSTSSSGSSWSGIATSPAGSNGAELRWRSTTVTMERPGPRRRRRAARPAPRRPAPSVAAPARSERWSRSRTAARAVGSISTRRRRARCAGAIGWLR